MDLVCDDPLVSRRHLSLEYADGRLVVRDLGSRNGSFIHGVRVAEALLDQDETITIGATRILIRAVSGGRQAKLPPTDRFGNVIGASEHMRRLYPICERIAASDIPVILEGETGTGKEAMAEAIHEKSGRARGPFVVFDCTAVAAQLIESALFGHERGAFTGAVAAREGVFEQAHGGTLFLDEIGDLELALQAKLLRVLERGEVQRVGGKGWTHVDVRILSATRRDLEQMIQQGRFRDDLYYRLAVARIELPALRHRNGDIRILVEHFWNALHGPGQPPEDVLRQFDAYSWPGNVRELRNAVAHHIALGEFAQLEHLKRQGAPESPAAAAPNAPKGAGPPEDFVTGILAEGLPFLVAREKVMRAFEHRYLQWLEAKYGRNMTKAAAASGIARRYLYTIKARSG
jgi:two-component system response regulator HydG